MKTTQTIILFLLCLFHLNSYSQYIWEEVILPDTVDVKMIAFDSAGVHYIASNNGVYISEYGYQWEKSSLPDYVSYIYINENNTIYTGMNTLFRSFDNGITWDSIFHSPSGGITSICTKGDSNIFIGTWGGVFRSTDSTQTWEQVITAYNSEVFRAIVTNSSGILFTGSTKFTGGGSPGGVYRSNDNGTNWELSNLDYHFVYAMAINSADEVFVGTTGHYYNGGGRVFKSSDDGNIWETMYEHNLIATLDINDYDEISIGCRTQGYPGGINCSYDDGENWEEITNNLPSNSFDQVLFSPDNFLYSVTHFEDRLFRTETVVSVHTTHTNNIISKISVFPNPAREQIKINFCEDSSHKITIVNMAGTKVLEISTNPTEGLISVNIENLKPGLYVIHCANNNQSYTSSKFTKY